MTIHLHIYSTSHCHLCEQAEALLEKISTQYDVQWTNIEITNDPALYEHYEITIPVLKRLDTQAEIAWPFDTQDIEQLLSA